MFDENFGGVLGEIIMRCGVAILLSVRTRVSSRALYCGVD